MPFEQTVESLDSVPEDARPFYRKGQDGKFNLITADSIDKLENTLRTVKGELGETKTKAQQAAAWEKLGKTPDEIAELLKAQEEAERKKAEEAGEWDKLKAQMEGNFNKSLEEKDGVIGRYRSALEKNLIDAAATSAIAELKGVPALLLPHIRDRVKVEEKDGEFSVVVLDEDRKTPKLNATNQPMSIKELVAAMREDETFGRAFEAPGGSGGGGQGGGGGQQGGYKKKSEMTAREKAAAMQELGVEGYAKLP